MPVALGATDAEEPSSRRRLLKPGKLPARRSALWLYLTGMRAPFMSYLPVQDVLLAAPAAAVVKPPGHAVQMAVVELPPGEYFPGSQMTHVSSLRS